MKHHHPHHSQPARCGKGLLMFLLTVIVISVIAYIGWVTYRSYVHTGSVNPSAVLDAEQRQLAHSDAQPHMQRALDLGSDALARLKELTQETFADGGYIDRASAWMRRSDNGKAPIEEAIDNEAEETPPPSSGSAPDPRPSPLPTKSPQTLRLEQQILAAERTFQDALRHYEAADPRHGGWTPERRAAVRNAHQGFLSVRDQLTTGSGDLYTVVEAYGRQSDHSPAVLRRAREMTQHNQRLLTTARRMQAALD